MDQQKMSFLVKTAAKTCDHFEGYTVFPQITDTGDLVVSVDDQVKKIYANGQWLTASYEKAE